MDPITALGIGSAVIKGGAGIFGSIAGHNDQVAQARAQNEAMMKQYEHRLRIRDKQYKDTQQIYATKLGQYDLQMKAADRAASRAFEARSAFSTICFATAGFSSKNSPSLS